MGKGKNNSVTKMKKMEEKVQNQRKITRKQNTIKEEEDRISALEDCLLLEIISRLPSTKEAIRTGSLSKRWQHLWIEVPTLIFQYHNTTYSPWNLFQFIENPEAELKFFSSVEQTLLQCRQYKIKTFELITSYNIGFRSQVRDWIRCAIKFNVEELNLILWNKRLEVKFELDQLFFTTSSFTHLNLEGCILNPTGAVTWNNLVSLCLVREELDEGLIENMLSGSPLLETLILYRCYGYTRLDITSKSVKNLELYGYGSDYVAANDGSYVVEINAPTILSLKIRGRFSLSKILLLNVSSVVEAELDFTKDGKFSTHLEEEAETLGFVKRLCHVKELVIGSISLKTLACLEDKGFTVPSNIKYIYSDDDSDSNGDQHQLLLDRGPDRDEVN